MNDEVRLVHCSSFIVHFRFPYCHIETPLMILVVEGHERGERFVERLVDLCFEQRIQRRWLVVVPDQLRMSDCGLRGVTLKVPEAVVLLVANEAAIHGPAKTGCGAENRKAFRC